MNIFNRGLLGYLLVFFVAAFLFWPLPPLEEIKEKPNKLEEKSAPSDYFFLQHTFPDDKPNVKAFTKAMKSARTDMLSRSAVLPGFDYAWDLRGPGDAGARVNAIAVHPIDENIMIAGYSAGGIFKTTDGGTTWTPVFDDQPYLAIGDIVFDPNDPSIVYAGTGDPNITSYPFIGEGLYKSTDTGDTWTNIGLTQEGIISSIAVDPTDGDVIYAGTMGLPFAKSNKRGLYKTTDGGANWSQVLFLSDSTGVIDLLMNPDDPQVLYAAGWDRIRNNSQSIISGNGARIHRSTDGGQNWTELGNGLPTGPLSRIALAMSGNDPDHVFALYVGLDFNIHGLYKSVDAGNNWSTLPTDQSTGLFSNALGGFGWYFGELRVDPTNENRIYILGVQLWASLTGGTSWYMLSQLSGSIVPHVDHHAMTFSPSGDIIIGSDGGMYRMEAGTNAWEDIEDIPATQFYRTGYNPHEPDAYYGGTQDNGTQKGNRSNATDWDMIFGGDGFQTLFHPTNPDVLYVETQNGNIWASDNGGVGYQYGSDGLNSAEPKNWDMQYIMSPHNPDILYTGTDRLYISTNGAIPIWTAISGVLAAPDGQTAARYHVMTTLSESPIDSALIYVGTSDAKVQRKNPSDGTWTDVSSGLPVRYVTDVVASPDDADVVFVSHSGYRDGELISHLHRSNDRGDNWIDISGDLPPVGVNDLIIMANYNGQVVFAGTDAGVYATLDGGSHWERLGLGVPLVPVYDMAYNEVHNELVAATHARSIYSFPLDSIGVSNMPIQISLSGIIQTEDGEPINAVDISNGQASTQADGTYTLNTISGNNCTVDPSRTTNVRSGISVLDLVMIQRDLLLVEQLDSPYKIIAADVNNSGSMNVTDLVLIQRVLLFVDNAFPNNESWRFIDANYVFTDPTDPLDEDFPEVYDCTVSPGNVSGVDFVGLKVGDVSGNASPNVQGENTDRLWSGEMDLSFMDQVFTSGEELEVTFKIAIDAPLLALQTGLQMDPDLLEILEVIAGSEEMAIPGELQYVSNAEGALSVLWSDAEGQLDNGNHDLMTLRLRAKGKGRLAEAISRSGHMQGEAVFNNRGNLEQYEVAIRSEISTGIATNFSSEAAIQVFPNPFSPQQSLQVQLPVNSEGATLLLWQNDGKLLLQKQIVNEKSIQLETADLPGSGLYYLQINGKTKSKLIPLICQ